MQSVKLNTGLQIPSVGFGTFLISPKQTQQLVGTALKLGYRHIDTAQLYGNEREVGLAIKGSNISRSDIFVTTKLWESEWGFRKASSCIQNRLASLDLEYIDLVLLHTPGNPALRAETWDALQQAHEQGHVKNIGVSNFGIGHLEKLRRTAKVVPAVNQIELSPFLQREKLVDYCRANGILLEAYSPLCKGMSSRLADQNIISIAQEAKKTPAQILIRWSLQKGFVPLPKSVRESRIAENIQAFDFELSNDQMAQLDSLESNFVTAWDPTETDPV